MTRFFLAVGVLALWCSAGCGGGTGGAVDGGGGGHDAQRPDVGPVDAYVPPPPPASCDEGTTPTATTALPTLAAMLSDRWHEAWLASPAVADLDGDGENEIIAPRDELVLGWHLDGTIVFRAETGGRVWASPVVADIVSSSPGLEVAVSSRGSIHVFSASAVELPGFPFTWRDELRSLAAADLDLDGTLELVAVTTDPLDANDPSGTAQRDILIAVHADGTMVDGFPANTSGASGCDDACYVTGGYDQNLAIGDVAGDGHPEIFATQDDAYLSLHDFTGRAFDAAPIFDGRTKFLGVRGMLDYRLAQQGYADDEAVDLQAHYTNSAPAIADVDGDGVRELVVLGSVQTTDQNDRFRGVVLFALHPDGTRPAAWVTPFHAPEYLAGLWDFDGTNVVGATNEVSVAELDPDREGPEFVFAGFDGRIHAVDARAQQIWQTDYTTSDRVLTSGVVIADLTQDGVPEVVFATYSPDPDLSHLVILGANGAMHQSLALPGRGAMPVPTIADVDGDHQLEILVSLKGGDDRAPQVLVYTVPGSGDACMLWPTGRRDLLRDGLVP
jgi:hypothetical protein